MQGDLEQAASFAAERAQQVVAWRSGRPVIAELNPEYLQLLDPTASHAPLATLDISEMDGVLLRQLDSTFVCVRYEETVFTVTELKPTGQTETHCLEWDHADDDEWYVADLIPAVNRSGSPCTALLMEEPRGGKQVVLLDSGRIVSGPDWSERAGDLVHVDWPRLAVLSHPEDPYEGKVTVESLDGTELWSGTGRWCGAVAGSGLVRSESGSGTVLTLIDLACSDQRRQVHVGGWVSDARLVESESGTAVIVYVTVIDGLDCLVIMGEEAYGEERGRIVLRGGRILLQTVCRGAVGVYTYSTLDGSAWHWCEVGPTQELTMVPGRVTPARGGTLACVVLRGGVPALVYRPRQLVRGCVINFHGGPESLERDELRYDGLYRWLLKQGVMVIGVNYPGSVGFGRDLQVRAWGNWTDALRRSLEGCHDLLTEAGLDQRNCVFLGGSFGAALALLATSLWPVAAGAVACSPLVDLGAHAAQACEVSQRYHEWFRTRFGVVPGQADQTFTAQQLARTGRVPVVVFHGTDDEVVGYEESRAMYAIAKELALPWAFWSEAGGGHVPATPEQITTRFSRLAQTILQMVTAGSVAIGNEQL